MYWCSNMLLGPPVYCGHYFCCNYFLLIAGTPGPHIECIVISFTMRHNRINNIVLGLKCWIITNHLRLCGCGRSTYLRNTLINIGLNAPITRSLTMQYLCNRNLILRRFIMGSLISESQPNSVIVFVFTAQFSTVSPFLILLDTVVLSTTTNASVIRTLSVVHVNGSRSQF